jgi:hypothetical protein
VRIYRLHQSPARQSPNVRHDDDQRQLVVRRGRAAEIDALRRERERERDADADERRADRDAEELADRAADQRRRELRNVERERGAGECRIGISL